MAELDEQIKLVTYAETIGVPVYHTPNEGKRTPWTGRQLAAAGLRCGVPDLCFPTARGGYFALYIEMKYGKNKPTAAQKRWAQQLRREGYAVQFAYSFEEGRAILDKYLSWAPTRPEGLPNE